MVFAIRIASFAHALGRAGAVIVIEHLFGYGAGMTDTTFPVMRWQSTLFGAAQPRLQDLRHLERIPLDDESWIDLGRDVVHGTDEIFAAVHQALPWQTSVRPMYDRMVEVPRLMAFLPATDWRFPSIVPAIASVFSEHYGEYFDRVGANLYRTGADSVAWHGDRVGRRVHNPIIAIVSLGGSRVFRLRPRHGGPGRSIPLHSGDILVMGGACQHRWEHAIPKVARAQPRISLTFRHDHSVDDRPGRFAPAAPPAPPEAP